VSGGSDLGVSCVKLNVVIQANLAFTFCGGGERNAFSPPVTGALNYNIIFSTKRPRLNNNYILTSWQANVNNSELYNRYNIYFQFPISSNEVPRMRRGLLSRAYFSCDLSISIK